MTDEILTLGPDEIYYITGTSKAELIGGAGTYVAIGARLVAGRANARHVGWIVDKGSDFPERFEEIINSWGTSVVYRSDSSRLTTRAWNGYGPGEHRDFKYLTPKLRLDENALSDSQLASSVFHMVCSPERCMSLNEGLNRRRQHLNPQPASRHQIVFEPIPDLCLPSELESLKLAMREVDVLSPNSEELAGFFDDSAVRTQSDMADLIINSGIGSHGNGALIVREGKDGATIYTKGWSVHLPAYHTAISSNMVKDPTGGGNAYLGALAMGLSRRVEPEMVLFDEMLVGTLVDLQKYGSSASTLLYSGIYASVAASYVIEQAGMPLLSVPTDGGGEVWNGESVASRLGKYIAREKDGIARSLRLN
jgi:sugar/nucleoside kinase (ribokinase family)